MKNIDKEEILDKARKENKTGDERDQMIEDKSAGLSNKLIISTFAILYIIVIGQKFFTGKEFADSNILMLGLLIGALGESINRYRYNKNIFNIFMMIIIALSVIASFALILMKAYKLGNI